VSVFDDEGTKINSQGQKPPLLKEVFAEFGDMFINIDLKPREAEDAQKLAVKVIAMNEL
jgi:hypothetical protein